MITLIIASVFDGSKKQFAKALLICLFIDSMLILSII